MNKLIEDHLILNVRMKFITNKFGRYWNSVRFCVPAVTDVRARLGKFSTPWNSQPDPLFTPPPFEFISDKLADIFDERAIELNEIAKQEGRKIVIMWSGGIDSTAVLASFIKNVPAQDFENYIIVLTVDSIEENPVFYEKFIQNKFKCISYIEYTINDKELSNSIMLNGDPADCLFGPSIFMYGHLIESGDYRKPFKHNIRLISEALDRAALPFVDKFKIQNFGTWYSHKITKNLLEVSPPGVDSIADWWWWHYYNFKWQYSVWRAILRRKANGFERDTLSQENIESYVKNTFFNTDRFQQWSYSNLKNHVINNDATTHKREVKEYIFDLDKNSSYLEYKTKIQSVPVYDHGLHFEIRKPFMWGKDWVGYYDNENPELVDECVELLEGYKG